MLTGSMPGLSLAMGIGEWRTLSALGEPARAEAMILHEAGDLIDANCFQLVFVGPNGEFPGLDDAKLSVRDGNKGLRLILESPRAISEPIAQVRIRMRCGVPHTRDMLLFFSPREQMRELEAQQTPTVVTDARAPKATQGNPTSKTAASKATSATPRKTTSKTPARATANKSGGTATTTHAGAKPRLVLSSELAPEIVDRLRLSRDLGSGRREATQAEREQLRRLYRSMMELADLKEGRAPSGRATAAPAPTATTQPSATTPAEAPAPAVAAPPPAAQVTPAVPPPGATQAATPTPPKAEEPKAMPLPPLDDMQRWWLPVVGALLLALLLGLFLLRRRRNGSRNLPEPIEPMPSIDRASIKSEPAREDSETLEALLEKENKTVAKTVDDNQGSSSFANVHGVTVHSETPNFLTSYRTMLDLADSMMAFGLINDAADALKEYVEEHPGVAVEPWLKLLDILRQSGKRADFDQYSNNLRQHFNLDLPGWDAPTISPASGDSTPGANKDSADLEERFRAAPSPLEAFPHVRDRLVSMWGKPECSAFLQHLMRDNRAGKRRGFPLIVIDDILLLLDITQELTGIDTEANMAERPEIFSDTW
jgi:LPXTG-motif cell wall-anchored protein